MSKKWTLENAVKKFKPEKMESLKRNKGNLNTRELESLIKEIVCFYEEVWYEGTGKKRIIYTDKKRKEKVPKEDKRHFNKGVAPAHSKHLALMVMNKMNDIDNKARTRNGWATYFGIISPAEQDIMKGIYSEEALKPYKEYMIGLGFIEGGEEEIFQDLANTLKNVVRVHFKTILDQAEELNLIRIISAWKGKVKNSKEPIDIDNDIAKVINSTEVELLKKHGINKWEALNFKKSPKTKEFKAEWLEYIENVEDEEGNAMQLQYIYEVFQIMVMKNYAFDEFIKAHYPSEINSFNLLENEEAYHDNLLDYVIENATKKHDNYLMKKLDKRIQNDEDLKTVMMDIGLIEEQAAAFVKETEVAEVNLYETEPSPYLDLLASKKYIDCVKNIHIRLHSMNEIEIEEIRAMQQMKEKQIEKELEQMGLTNPEKSDSDRNVKHGISINNKFHVDIEYHEELTEKEQIEQHQTNQVAKSAATENSQEEKVTIVSKVNPVEHFESIRMGDFSAFSDNSKKVKKMLKKQELMTKIEQEQIRQESEKQRRFEVEKLKAEWNKRQAETEAFRKKQEAETAVEAERIIAIINGN
ncbi:hypothetical protein [Neobacillus sp. LXY-1]|uniref:hypothetical protein n=1 Tax=Neobacillus sp. LXY-1 TaxID=3379133 RepID=UPI003EE3FEE6